MNEPQVMHGYAPAAGVETLVPEKRVSQADRDAFWMGTLGGDPYIVATNGVRHSASDVISLEPPKL